MRKKLLKFRVFVLTLGQKEVNMIKKSAFSKAAVLVVALASVLSMLAGCTKEPPPSEDQPVSEDTSLLDISEYSIIRYDNSEERVTEKTVILKHAINKTLGLTLSISEDWYNPNTPPDPSAKEILVDKTNRKESADALAKLESKTGDAYIIEITDNKIVIAGKTALSTARGINYFINNYVLPSENKSKIDISHGKSIIRDYSSTKNIWIEDTVDLDVEMTSTVLASSQKYSNSLGHNSRLDSVYFPSIIELQYQSDEKNNGKLIAATSIGETGRPSELDPSLGAVLESTDGGRNWKVIFQPVETLKPWYWAGQMAHIYELPEKVGNMPAGTLIYSVNTVNYGNIDQGGTSKGYSHISMFISYDAGKTWSQSPNIIAEGGGLRLGVWEPVMFYDNGYLYCFYSDDRYGPDSYTGLNYGVDQKLVYQRSKDGVTWETPVNVYSPKNLADRPGMPVITKMGNGEYFLIYENCMDNSDVFVYYKTTKDITKWNPSDPGKLLTAKYKGKDYWMASSPCCVWTPAGGENGTLFAMGRRQFGDQAIRAFVSKDYGKTWTTIEPPLPYDWYTSASAKEDGNDSIGYRPIMVLGKDPSIIHYINITEMDYIKGSRAQYARLKVYD